MSRRSAQGVDDLFAKASSAWKEQGSRMTSVRKILCQEAFATTGPFGPEDLLTKARSIDKLISPATVYRTLAQLVQLGLLREVAGPRNQRLFLVLDSPTAGISHVLCSDCGQMIPLADPCLHLREGALARQQGFSPTKISLQVEARCDEWREKGSCPRRRADQDAP
jgi:Fur family transcriptional regulator, ferric uptake regulator